MGSSERRCGACLARVDRRVSVLGGVAVFAGGTVQLGGWSVTRDAMDWGLRLRRKRLFLLNTRPL